jgi:hypothetical protein
MIEGRQKATQARMTEALAADDIELPNGLRSANSGGRRLSHLWYEVDVWS